MESKSEPGYTRERKTVVREVPRADYHSEPIIRARPLAPVDTAHRPSRHTQQPSPAYPPAQNFSQSSGSDSSEDSDDITDTESEHGFPFHAPSISKSGIETRVEKTSNGENVSSSDVQALHSSPTQDVFSFDFSRYLEKEDDRTDVYANFVHRSLQTKTASRAQPIFQWV